MKAYPVYGKAKSADICKAFIAGAPKDATGSVFFGIESSNEEDWRRAQLENDYWYADNSYFDSVRQEQFRVTHNAMQHSGIGKSDGVRFKALGIPIKPWHYSGKHILVCPQSAHFMRLSGYYGDWTAETVTKLSRLTDRPIRIRLWSPDKAKLSATLEGDLVGAHCLVTHSSAAAVTALLSGVPVICTGPSACNPLAGNLEDVEDLPMPDRLNWANVLADAQFSLAEMRDGTAWSMLRD